MKVYILNIENEQLEEINIRDITDEYFKELCALYGECYTLKGFEDAFNDDEGFSISHIIRILD